MIYERDCGMEDKMSDLQRAVEIANSNFSYPHGIKRNVMVAFTSGRTERKTRRHLKLKRDDEGLYVRVGKRGSVKKYLTQMAGARIMCDDLVLFYEV